MTQKSRDSLSRPQGATDHVRSTLEWVIDHFTGEQLLRKDAVQIRLGPGKLIWIPKHCCRET